VNFVDATLLKLATPADRANLFDQHALAQIAATAYDVDALAIEGPYQPHFDELRLGPNLPPVATVEGAWQPQTSTERTDVRVHVSGLAGPLVQRVDALWRGGIVARAIPLDSVIEEVTVDWPDPGLIDDEIRAAGGGALPGNPTTLENQRRQRLIDHIKAGLTEPDLLTDERFDALLASVGTGSVGDLIERVQAAAAVGTVNVTFSPPTAKQPTPKDLPLAAVLLIRDAAGLSLADLLAESHALRDRLDPLGFDIPSDTKLKRRTSLIVIWLLPIATFDDADWPGATAAMSAAAKRDARRAAAGEWLAAEGIGLVTVT
jgi:hypothetical protein